MSGRFIISLTGGFILLLRFINRLLGFFLFFTGAWIVIITYVAFVWLRNFSTWFTHGTRENISYVLLAVGILLAIASFISNIHKLFVVMPDNRLKRFMAAFLSRSYRPEREGNNIPGYMLNLFRDRIGFFFGTKIKSTFLGFSSKMHYVSKPTAEDGHILVVGGAGSGKSSCIAIPSLETWVGGIFAIDIKGELSAYYSSIENSDKRPHIIFDPTDENAKGYDPYYMLRNSSIAQRVQYAKEIALSIIPTPQNMNEPFWIKAAQDVLTGAILYYFDMGEGFIETMLAIQSRPISELIEDISCCGSITIASFVNQVKDTKVETQAGIGTEISNHIMVFAVDPLIRDALSKRPDDCFLMDDIEGSNIFLRLPEDKLEQWGSVLTLMLNQRIRSLERRADKSSAKGRKLSPILLLLDEFPRLGKVESIKSALATLRSKGVTICLMIQSLAQLDEIYGRDARRTLLDNCPYKAILKVTDADSQEYFSRLSGTSEVEKRGYSINYDPNAGIEVGSSDNYNLRREPMVFPHEFAMLNDIVLITPDGFSRVDKAPYYEQELIAPPVKKPPMKLTDVTEPIKNLCEKIISSGKSLRPRRTSHELMRDALICVVGLFIIICIVFFGLWTTGFITITFNANASSGGVDMAAYMPQETAPETLHEPDNEDIAEPTADASDQSVSTETPVTTLPPDFTPLQAPRPSILAPPPSIPRQAVIGFLLDSQNNTLLFALDSGEIISAVYLGLTAEGTPHYFVDFTQVPIFDANGYVVATGRIDRQAAITVPENWVIHTDPDTSEAIARLYYSWYIDNFEGGRTRESREGSGIVLESGTIFIEG